MLSLTRAKEARKAKRRAGKEGRQEERINVGRIVRRISHGGIIMRPGYTGDEYSPMYRIMIHDEYGMTMRDLIRECMFVIGPNTVDLPWRYWTVLGPASFHTLPHIILSSFRCWGSPLTAVTRERCERTMRGRFYLSASPSIFSPILKREFDHFK